MDQKSKFTNVSGGVAGAVQLDHEGHAKGVAIFPGESIWLTEQEEVLTANAPRNESDNPFTNGSLRLDVRAVDAGHARPIGSKMDQPMEERPPLPPEASEGDPESIDLKVETGAPNDPPKQPEPEPPAADTGAPPAPTGEPVAGQRQPTEEAAVVEEPAQAADPDAAESLAPKPAVTPPAAPEPKPGQSKRDARADGVAAQAAAPRPKPAAATPAQPAQPAPKPVASE